MIPRAYLLAWALGITYALFVICSALTGPRW